MSDIGGEKIGLKTAVAGVIEAQGGVAVPDLMPVEQLDLLPLRKAGADGQTEIQDLPSRGAGRPPGAKNRRTQEMADYLLSRYQSPLVALAETYSRNVRDLAKELACDKLEAFKLQIAAAKELAPYLHQKLPIAIDTGEKGLIHLTINAGSAEAAQAIVDDNGLAVKFLDVIEQNETEENQYLSDQSEENSNGQNSNGTQETPENKGEVEQAQRTNNPSNERKDDA